MGNAGLPRPGTHRRPAWGPRDACLRTRRQPAWPHAGTARPWAHVRRQHGPLPHGRDACLRNPRTYRRPAWPHAGTAHPQTHVRPQRRGHGPRRVAAYPSGARTRHRPARGSWVACLRNPCPRRRPASPSPGNARPQTHVRPQRRGHGPRRVAACLSSSRTRHRPARGSWVACLRNPCPRRRLASPNPGNARPQTHVRPQRHGHGPRRAAVCLPGSRTRHRPAPRPWDSGLRNPHTHRRAAWPHPADSRLRTRARRRPGSVPHRAVVCLPGSRTRQRPGRYLGNSCLRNPRTHRRLASPHPADSRLRTRARRRHGPVPHCRGARVPGSGRDGWLPVPGRCSSLPRRHGPASRPGDGRLRSRGRRCGSRWPRLASRLGGACHPAQARCCGPVRDREFALRHVARRHADARSARAGRRHRRCGPAGHARARPRRRFAASPEPSGPGSRSHHWVRGPQDPRHGRASSPSRFPLPSTSYSLAPFSAAWPMTREEGRLLNGGGPL
jgi:hypothetical protein